MSHTWSYDDDAGLPALRLWISLDDSIMRNTAPKQCDGHSRKKKRKEKKKKIHRVYKLTADIVTCIADDVYPIH